MDYKKQAEIDLHIHSNASDGSFSPGDILRLAARLGLKAISITDHDTLDGVKEALRIGIPESIRFLPGVEISAQLPPDFEYAGGCHILGYFIDPDNLKLNAALEVLKDARITRNPAIIKKLNALGIDIAIEALGSDVHTLQAGRPHIARALINKKVVGSIDEAFEKYLGYGKPAYVGKFRLPCAEAIELVRGAGGIPVLAHPFLIKGISAASFDTLIKSLIAMGLMGMEVYYPDHTADMTAYYASVAERFGLLVTGGTDFHGTFTPHIEMGAGKGDLHIPYTLYENLIVAKSTIGRYAPGKKGTVMAQKEVFEIDQLLGYRFKNPSLLEESLRHSSYVNEQNDKNMRNNERLEFLGDAVLNLGVSHMLMQRFPDNNEGSLSRMRSAMVNESRLAEIAQNMNLGGFICLGKGEMQSNGFEKPSILANALEALIAAIYLDGGYDAVFAIVQKLFASLMNAMEKTNVIPDYKTRLQELTQLRQLQMPQYATVKETGPDHDKTFVVELSTGAITVEGKGKSKKAAEQDAAEKAFRILENQCGQN